MKRSQALVLILPATLAAALLLALAALPRTSAGAGLAAMSIDMDTAGNTATSLGPFDARAEAAPGDSLVFDVTAAGIPPDRPLIGFQYTILYDDAQLPFQTQDHQFLLAAVPGGYLFSISDPTPDTRLDGAWVGAVADLSDTLRESDSGVLSRLSLLVSPSTPPGLYPLVLSEAATIDPTNSGVLPDRLEPGMVAVSRPCPTATPGPTAAPTATPAPTPIVTPGPVSATFDPLVPTWGNGKFSTVSGRLACASPQRIRVDVFLIQADPDVTRTAGASAGVDCDGQASFSIRAGALLERLRPGPASLIVELPDYEVGVSGTVQLVHGNGRGGSRPGD